MSNKLPSLQDPVLSESLLQDSPTSGTRLLLAYSSGITPRLVLHNSPIAFSHLGAIWQVSRSNLSVTAEYTRSSPYTGLSVQRSDT
jgi:hypothetical protein